MIDDARLASATASAVLGIDTVWRRRHEPVGHQALHRGFLVRGIPEAHTHPTAQALRA